MERFVLAQETTYQSALKEIKAGKKRTHWMWFIFPQIEGLGYSETSKYYAVRGPGEAKDYLAHPILGKRLKEISMALLTHKGNDAEKVFGRIDAQKLQSSMTLFKSVSRDPIFQAVLDKYFEGEEDRKTLRILKEGWLV